MEDELNLGDLDIPILRELLGGPYDGAIAPFVPNTDGTHIQIALDDNYCASYRIKDDKAYFEEKLRMPKWNPLERW